MAAETMILRMHRMVHPMTIMKMSQSRWHPTTILVLIPLYEKYGIKAWAVEVDERLNDGNN